MTRQLTIATLIAFGLAAPRADAGSSCHALLVDNAYRCQVRTAPDAAPSERCLTFADSRRGIAVDRFFCSCSPRGKLSNLAFDASAEFLCAGSEFVTDPDGTQVRRSSMLSGQATRTAIKRGFGLRDDGQVEAFDCKLDPTCAPGD